MVTRRRYLEPSIRQVLGRSKMVFIGGPRQVGKTTLALSLIGPGVRYFAERTAIPRFFQVHRGDRHYESGRVTVLPFGAFCRELGLP